MHRLAEIALLIILASAASAGEVTREQIKGLDEQVQDIKSDVIALTSELTRLEERLLFPSNTQVALFVSLTEGDEFRLDSVQVKLDDKVVAHHLYTFRELEALQRGGVQRIYTGNIRSGEHELVASLIGLSREGDEYKRSATYKLVKEVGPKFVEIKIAGPESTHQDFLFKDW